MSSPSPEPGASSGLATEVAAIFVKDWRCELRTGYALHAIGLFSITTLVTVSLALGPLGVSSAERLTVLPTLLWVILLFAASVGIPRGFVLEEETHTATALRLSARPSAVFLGKLFYSISLLAAIEVVLVPLFLAVMQLPVSSWLPFVGALGAGGLGLAATSTLVAAMVAHAQSKGALFPVLSFPVVLPLLLLAIDLTRAAVGGFADPVALSQLLLYDGIVAIASLMLFPAIWHS